MINEIQRYIVAAIQFEPAFGNKEENIFKLCKASQEAAQNGAKLIVLPEMATTGYCFYSRDEISSLVETIPGPTTNSFLKICQQFGCYIVVGMPEIVEETGHYYNSAVLIGPGGVIGSYRKTHPYISEPKWARDGDKGFPVFQTELGRIGMLICMDNSYFEPARLLALQGADVLCNPTNWCEEKGPGPSWYTRAYENQVYLVSADRWGVERGVQFSGGTSIINPDGTMQSYLDSGEGIVYGEVDLKLSRDKQTNIDNSFISQRRPELYYALTLNPYTWNPLNFHRLYNHKPLPKGKKSVIAVGQFEPTIGNVRINFGKIRNMVADAAGAGAELIVLPELSLSGTVKSKKEAETMAVELNATVVPEVSELAELSHKYNIYIVLGIIEKGENQKEFYNTVVLINQDGIVGKYRKAHLSESDKKWAALGEKEFPVFDLPLGRIGLLTGYDSLFPETTMSLAVAGADLLCIPSAINGPKPAALKASQIYFPNAVQGDDDTHWHLWRTRAVETSSYLAFANMSGPDYMGYSGIFGPYDNPRDEQLANDKNTKVLVLSIDTGVNEENYAAVLARAKDMVRMRLPHLYSLLVEK